MHELSHLHPIDPELVPAPTSLHEALAAHLSVEQGGKVGTVVVECAK